MLLDYDEVQKIIEKHKDILAYYDRDDFQVWDYVKTNQLYANISVLRNSKTNEWQPYEKCLMANNHYNEDEYWYPRTEEKGVRIYVITEIIPDYYEEEKYYTTISDAKDDLIDVPFKTKDKIVVKEMDSIEEFENYILQR